MCVSCIYMCVLYMCLVYIKLNMAQTIKNLPAMQETWVSPLLWEDPWRRAWQLSPLLLSEEAPWGEESDGLQYMRSQRVRYD